MYLFANQEALKMKSQTDIASAGMLTEDSTPNFNSQADPSVQQAFLKRVIDTSMIHKSIAFTDTSCQIDHSVIGRNVSVGSNVRI